MRRFSQTAYAVHDPKTGRWSKWQILEMPADDKFNMARNGCSQWLVQPDGTLLVPMTIRNDVKGYVTFSDDGLRYQPIKPWTFDDGSELGSYNTQQHWLAHSDGLFLSYTRRGAKNDHIPRNRAPIFLAQVDPEKPCVIRKSEKPIIPQRGAMLGNFYVPEWPG